MSKVKIGNGASLESYLRGSSYHGLERCDCGGTEVSAILSSLTMAGSNLYYLYSGMRCAHGEPIKAAAVAYVVENYHEPAIKIKGRTNIKSWLSQMMKGSVALVFFRSNGVHGGTALDLYLGDRLWVNSGVDEMADEMWVWCMGSPIKSLKKHGHKGHKKTIHMF